MGTPVLLIRAGREKPGFAHHPLGTRKLFGHKSEVTGRSGSLKIINIAVFIQRGPFQLQAKHLDNAIVKDKY